MKQNRRRLRLRDDRGAAAVEFALVFPLLLVVMIGIFEFGRAWNLYQVVTDAAREGARRAVVSDGLTGNAKRDAVMLAINNRLTSAGLPAATLDGTPHTTACPTTGTWTPPGAPNSGVTVAGCGWNGASDTQARVLIRTPFPFQFLGSMMSLIGGGGMGPITLGADVSMRNE